MAEQSEMLRLAGLCEQSEGPTKGLDREIAIAVTGDSRNYVRRYTASLDAAMQLVPDELVTVVMREALDRLDAAFSPMDNYLAKLRLYACAAALRARASVGIASVGEG